MSSNNNSSSGGIGFVGALTIVFIVLRLVPSGNDGRHLINWSWWWVLSPIWISTLLFLVLLAIILTVVMIKDR